MLWNPCHMSGLDAHQQTILAGRPAQRTGSSSWPIATTLLSIPYALHRGLAAYRQYEHLKSRGISHDTALRETLGVCIPTSESRTDR
jgi:hypothetical protein